MEDHARMKTASSSGIPGWHPHWSSNQSFCVHVSARSKYLKITEVGVYKNYNCTC